MTFFPFITPYLFEGPNVPSSRITVIQTFSETFQINSRSFGSHRVMVCLFCSLTVVHRLSELHQALEGRIGVRGFLVAHLGVVALSVTRPSSFLLQVLPLALVRHQITRSHMGPRTRQKKRTAGEGRWMFPRHLT